ncbi:sugar phosphate isomerase/epimerase family protein [Parapedobacter deserti]|uniref:Sugar phosphate isomerase/epimerase family protein n=1 Tax=Parapedobacter deserti TaxID=1912957 RepID=A0ABV7JLG2_9SPHI
MNRRTTAKLLLAGGAQLLVGGLLRGAVRGIAGTPVGNPIIGLQTYSLRDRPFTEAVAAMSQLGIGHCELWEGHVEPWEYRWRRGLSAEEQAESRRGLAEWRQHVAMEALGEIRNLLGQAGIRMVAYNATFKDGISDHDLDLAFRIAVALGVDTINSSATVNVMPRVDKCAQQYGIRVGLHNHANVHDPNEFATPESFFRGLSGRSDYIGINLDTGHFTAAGYDPLAFIEAHHERIFSIHLKDRLKGQGARVPFGMGDTPLAAILQLIQRKQWAIPACIEYEYEGGETVVAIRQCLDYCYESLNQNSSK